MWVITYSVNWHYRDRDNYADCNHGYPETWEGETLKEALEYLISETTSDSIIDSYAKQPYDGYYTVEIFSCYKVIKEVGLVFENIPAVRDKIAKAKASIIYEQMEKDKKEAENEKAREKELLKKLKQKYE